MKKFLRKKKNFLKSKTINNLMFNGKKTTGEKIILKFAKFAQKTSNKKFTTLLQSAIINSTPVFSVNTQIVKKGKKKVEKVVPSFLQNHSLRIKSSLLFLKNAAEKDKKVSSFYKMLAYETIKSSDLEGYSVNKKVEVQKQVLVNKRYWSKFKW